MVHHTASVASQNTSIGALMDLDARLDESAKTGDKYSEFVRSSPTERVLYGADVQGGPIPARLLAAGGSNEAALGSCNLPSSEFPTDPIHFFRGPRGPGE